jgi:predicted kinase
MKGKLYFLIGIARSGKSTIAKRWQNYEIDIKYNQLRKHVGMRNIPRIVVCADWIRLALHGQPFAIEAEEMVHTIKNLMIKTYLDNGYDVLVDGTHTTKNSIQQLLHIDRNADFYVVNTSPEECKQRAIDTNQQYLIDHGVITRMARQLDIFKYNPTSFVDSLRPK